MKSQEQIIKKLEDLNNLLDRVEVEDEMTEIKTWQWIDALNWVLNEDK